MTPERQLAGSLWELARKYPSDLTGVEKDLCKRASEYSLAAAQRAERAEAELKRLADVARVLSGHRVTADRTAGQWSRLHSAIDRADAALSPAPPDAGGAA